MTLFERRDPPVEEAVCISCAAAGVMAVMTPNVSESAGWTGSWTCPRCHQEGLSSEMVDQPWYRAATKIRQELRSSGLTWRDLRAISDIMTSQIGRLMLRDSLLEEERDFRAETEQRLLELRQASAEERA